MDDKVVTRIWMLLEIADKSRQWPKLKLLHDAVMGELEAVDLSDEPKPRAVFPSEDLRSQGEAQNVDRPSAITRAESLTARGEPPIERKI